MYMIFHVHVFIDIDYFFSLSSLMENCRNSLHLSFSLITSDNYSIYSRMLGIIKPFEKRFLSCNDLYNILLPLDYIIW